ncbi:MAG: hypothetical protein E6Q33_05090 [Neisseriales bacterium]|nr:MAG: hypothetical protein E6Q33_05090 [Neisseriales bacterium]
MTELYIKSELPNGIAWNWVKESFAIFREKPINFLFLSIAFILFSFFPFIGSILGVFVLVRIYLTIDKALSGESIGLRLSFGEIIVRRNILNYALLSMLFDLFGMLIVEALANYWQIDMKNQSMLADKRIVIALGGVSLFRMGFFGISLAILSFNPKLQLLKALKLNWKLMLKHWAILLLSCFLLLPFLIIPLYLGIIIAFSSENTAIFAIGFFIMALTILVFIMVTTAFCYKIYKDGITNVK